MPFTLLSIFCQRIFRSKPLGTPEENLTNIVPQDIWLLCFLRWAKEIFVFYTQERLSNSEVSYSHDKILKMSWVYDPVGKMIRYELYRHKDWCLKYSFIAVKNLHAYPFDVHFQAFVMFLVFLQKYINCLWVENISDFSLELMLHKASLV